MMSLGCPKTLVDSEVILGKLQGEAYTLVPSVADCDVALLNTCAFIEDAQQESLDKILELVALKKEKQIRALIVMGCLVQRFPKDLQEQLREVDAFIGSGDYAKIPEIVKKVTGGGKVFSVGRPGYLGNAGESRVALTPKHYRYLKISEGCDHVCTFCSIPSFRGKHRSRTSEDVLREAQSLVEAGAREIILTGQDTTYFGRDLTGRFLLPELVRELGELKGLGWLRILYAYPSCITRELMLAMRDVERVCPYLDMPLQHASDRMLGAMQRGITKRRTLDLIREFRATVPELGIRTTFIVGFPGETEQDFEELLDFMREIRFERLGLFTYSREEGTPSAGLPDQVPEKIKQERWHRAMELQQEISRANNAQLLGRKTEMILDEKHPDEENTWIGRTRWDAPDVDGNIFLKSSQALEAGAFYQAKITDTRDYDLVGEL